MNAGLLWLKPKNPVFAVAYRTFGGMQQRCTNRNDPRFHRYGGRGIQLKVSRTDFIDWYIRTAKGRTDLTVDRIDNDGHYELSNVQLITCSENTRKECQESKAWLKNTLSNARRANERKSICVRIGDCVFPSLSEASRALSRSRAYIRTRIRDYNSRMPDGTEITMDG